MQTWCLIDRRAVGYSPSPELKLLNMAKPLGRGRTSQVFKTDGDTAIRLTVDKASHEWIVASMGARKLHPIAHRHMPVCIRDLGVMGHMAGSPMHLLEMERLDRVGKHRRLWNAVDVLDDAFNDSSSKMRETKGVTPEIYNQTIFDEMVAAVKKYEAATGLSSGELAGILLAVKHACDFSTAHDSWLDVHEDNLMVRRSTGDLVIVDPCVSRLVAESLPDFASMCK